MSISRVAVLGASTKPERYSNKAIKRLKAAGHEVIPVAPTLEMVEGLAVKAHLGDIKERVDTLTVYLGPGRIGPVIPEIVALNPERVILNPGTEAPELKEALRKAEIPYEEACTLVLLSTNQF